MFEFRLAGCSSVLPNRLAPTASTGARCPTFMNERLVYLLEQRGFDVRNVRAVMHAGVERLSALETRRKLEALGQMSGSEALLGVAALLKRVKNISKDVAAPAS